MEDKKMIRELIKCSASMFFTIKEPHFVCKTIHIYKFIMTDFIVLDFVLNLGK